MRNGNPRTINDDAAKKHVCKYCGLTIKWDILMHSRKWIPLNPDLTPHYYNCLNNSAAKLHARTRKIGNLSSQGLVKS